MNVFLTLIKKEFLEIYRSKKLLILVIIFAFTAISSPILAKLLPTLLKSMPQTPGIAINIPDPTWRDAIDQLVKNTAQFGLLVLIFMFSGAIAEEKNRKTFEMVLTKPISRAQVVLSKFFAGGMVIKLIFIASAVVFYLYTLSLFESFSLVNYVWLSIFLLLYLVVILAASIFFSTLFNNQILAVGVNFLSSIAVTTIIGSIGKVAKYSPAYINSNYKDLMSDGRVAIFLPSAITSIILVFLLIWGAVLIFKGQEIER